MTRTDRNGSGTGKAPKNANTTSSRRSQISHALSKLLRHQAENEKIPISAAGWVSLDDILAWRGLERIDKVITVREIFNVVEEDGRVGKGRFAVQYVGDDNTNPTGAKAEENTEQGSLSADGAATGNMIDATTTLNISDSATAQPARPPSPTTSHAPTFDPTSKNSAETQSAMHRQFTHPNTPASHYQLRATQGHSMKSVQSADLLTPLTLTTEALPTTVVHGTFYGAWHSILSTGGLKPMGRNNVHFATGPPLDEVMSLVTDTDATSAGGMKNKSQVDEVLSRNKVISGMRWDAQLLIYIDLKRCLEDVKTKGTDMTWWMSGNGVVLTEGVAVGSSSTPAATEEPLETQTPVIASKAAKARQHHANVHTEKIVPVEYWIAVVEIKNGLGVIWKQGEGVVKELPERLRSMPVPAGKSRGSGQMRRGGKPRLNVERGGRVEDGSVDDTVDVAGDAGTSEGTSGS